MPQGVGVVRFLKSGSPTHVARVLTGSWVVTQSQHCSGSHASHAQVLMPSLLFSAKWLRYFSLEAYRRENSLGAGGLGPTWECLL